MSPFGHLTAHVYGAALILLTYGSPLNHVTAITDVLCCAAVPLLLLRYWRNLLTFTNWAPCTLPDLGDADADDLPLPPGWDTVGVFNLPPPPGVNGETLPFAALIKVRLSLTVAACLQRVMDGSSVFS
jgi:hypothetical protein